jgi:hypothetical protein
VAVDFTTVAPLANPTFTGTVGGITRSMVGLGNVDNTSDANKPISSATQTALNLKQNTLNGTGFVKASGTNITYDNSSYLTTSSAASTYLPLTGGTLTGALNGTRLNLNSGIDVSGDFSTSYHTNVSALFRGYQVLISPNNDYGQTRIHFPNRPVTEGFSEFGSGVRHKFDGSDARNSFLSLYTSSSSSLQIDAVSINSLGNVGIKDTTPSFTLDVNGTLGVTGAATLSSTLAVTGAITEAGNNVLTNLDTVSLSNRINGKVSLTGNETVAGIKTFSNKIILNDSSRFESDVLFKKNFGLPIVKISNANYTATTANHTIIYTTLTSDKTLTIPNAADAIGVKYTVSIFDSPEGNETLTIVTPANNSFVITDGEGASVGIVGGYCAILQSDGIKWYVLSYSPMY